MATSSVAVAVAEYGETASGERVRSYTLTNGNGVSVTLLDLGATIVSVLCPSASTASLPAEITLCDAATVLSGTPTNNPYFGATVGRYANRIAGGEFTLEGRTHTLAKTFNGHHSHGGVKGWHAYVWKVVDFGVRRRGADAFVELQHSSPDGDEGYPGAVLATAIYSLSRDNEIGMEFRGVVSGRSTPLNMCNHVYWNLSGGLERDVTHHTVQLFASRFVDVDALTQIPTGTMPFVVGGDDERFDFRTPLPLGKHIASVSGGGQVGYDHSFVIDSSSTGGAESVPAASAIPSASAALLVEAHALDRLYQDERTPAGAPALSPAGVLSDPVSGRTMCVYTSQPCIHAYTANFMPASGTPPFAQHWAICLETQYPPDSPNQPLCGSCIVSPGTTYRHLTVHKLSWDGSTPGVEALPAPVPAVVGEDT